MRGEGAAKQYLFLFSLLVGTTVAMASRPSPVQPQYVSTVQIVVQEPSPQLLRRSQNLAMEALANVFDSWPELTGKRYEIKKVGKQIVSYLITGEDMRLPLQRAVSVLFAELSDKTRAKGRFASYVADLEKPVGGYGIVVDDSHTQVLSVSAESVPLRDVLKGMKARLASLSYWIPGDCMDRVVDWQFGTEEPGQPKPVAMAMQSLATSFHLQLVREQGKYIFNGNCRNSMRPRAVPMGDMVLGNYPGVGLPSGGYRITQVGIPISSLGE